MSTPRLLVVGFGNILLGDEGIGVRAIEALQASGFVDPRVTFIDGGTSAMDLLDTLAGVDALVLIDAVRSGLAPGEIVRYADAAVPVALRMRASSHQAGIAEVLASLVLMEQAPGVVVLIGVEPLVLEMGLTLSPPVAAALPGLVTMVLEEIRRLLP
ncbi:MAG: HyaD/HybD family hydrogenase maturation endopeptidase [Magnetococcales bacterium]|nr:HyaD/HybD family hydrogenase maturation endopeptidase [Magnetococcales bacterium]